MPRFGPFPVLLLFVLVLSLGAAPTAAEEKEGCPGTLTLTTKRVVVFKNGYGLFVKQAVGIADEAGRVFTNEVPDAAVLGTFWAVSDDDAIVAMRAEWVEHEREEVKEVGCASVAELLQANVGVTVTLSLSLENRPRITGKILVVQPKGVPQLVLLEVGTDQVVLPISAIRSVEAKLLSTTRPHRSTITERTKRLSFDVGREAAGRPVTLHLMYFRPGIRWIPAYRLGGSWDGEATMALQAEVLNEAEDLDDVPLHLVVGVPNFRFRDVASPLTLESTLRGALGSRADQQLASRLRTQNIFSNAFAAEGEQAGGSDDGSSLRLAPELAAEGVEDLFVYDAPPIHLPRGARATVPLWTSGVPVEHIYTVDVRIERDEQRTAPGHLARNDVWHQIELTNRSTTPWTTGAALLLRNKNPVAQEMLGYTAPGATTLLPITVATDLRTEAVEVEASREPNAYHWGNAVWSLITVDGEIDVRSFRREASRLRVRVAVTGKADVAPEADVRILSGTGAVNPESVFTWSFDLPPAESRTLTYRYSFYTR